MEIKKTAIVLMLGMASLSACVTQQYENNSKEPLTQTVTNQNDMARTRISLGLGYLKIGNNSQAKLNLEKAKAYAPDLPQVHSAFAHYYETVGEVGLAIESYEEALSLDDENADTLNNYGVFLCRQNKIDQAEKYMLEAIAIPSYLLVAQSYENLALCMLTANEFDRAETYLEKAIAHSPNSTSSLQLMAKLQYAKGNYLKATKFILSYEKSAQRLSADALALAYKTNKQLNRTRIASNYANMLLQLFPNSFEAKQYLLNELAITDADELAQQYQQHLSATGNSGQVLAERKTKKRTVVLSPNGIKNTPAPKTVAQPLAEKPKQTTTAKRVQASKVETPKVETSKLENSTKQKNANNRQSTTVKTKKRSASTSKTIASSATNSTAIATAVTSSSPIISTAPVKVIEKSAEQVTKALTKKTDKSPEQNKPVQLLEDEVFSSPANEDSETSQQLTVEEVENIELVEFDPSINSDDIIAEAQSVSKETAGNELNKDALEEEPVSVHIVRAGENLFTISRKYNIRMTSLEKWNGITRSQIIKIGDAINVVEPK